MNSARLSDLRGCIDHRFDALHQILDARFAGQKAELLRQATLRSLLTRPTSTHSTTRMLPT